MDIINDQLEFGEKDSVMDVIVDAFHKFGVQRTFKKNEFVFLENDLPNAAYYVDSGLIKISQSSQEGQGITLFLRYAGEIFGNAEILSNLKRQRYARCLSDSEMITLDARKFLELARENSDFAYSLAVLGARRLLQTQKVVETLISRPVSWRLAWFLVQMGKPMDERLEILLQLSHEEISYVIGCSRQTITETLNKWSEKKLIDYTKKKIIIYNSSRFLADI
ncbi:Crp/Fnr family transcriptional regulator [Cohnella silvisoli]|uniref:Crp/Fnr family transcriptional regulator n=1 Tax=Cohnella silvisoli TaxID=2873699 RepID=A0ABV1KYD9_9BACL|nr:Crp/Fnr family transcriptional regulator [Cohnella silvisoli]MCD9021777.1 Crp/Fnr family transcriptional regulator [Cohnella silvisoli]